jgi:hypothetical protein
VSLLGILLVLGVVLVIGSLIYGLVARPSMRDAAEQRRLAEAEQRRSTETPMGPH